MGKRVKKGRKAPQKDKRATPHSPKAETVEKNASSVSVVDVASGVKERRLCPHIEKGVDLVKLSAKLASSDPVRCEDCRVGGSDRRASKGKGKPGKKKGSASGDSKSDSKAIWVCLDCGHYACAGVGLPSAAQSHALRHIRQTRHSLMIQWDNPQLRWCFPCSKLLPVQKPEENGEMKDVLADVVKLIKDHSSEPAKVDVEDVWFGSGSILNESKLEATASSSSDGGGYVARGLMNLGNTCFFNSVMQNLLALQRLRDYYLNQDLAVGPLNISLKKLVAETKEGMGSRNAINPRAFFGAICSKAPQFRGYQQHDSHELLHSLLDGLSSEELVSKKQINASMKEGTSQDKDHSFIDAVFGGQISSTVCCLECGHSSIVYEPYLDLSLPVPTKKPPSRSKVQPTSRSKKNKALPKKGGGRTRPKLIKHADLVSGQNTSKPSTSSTPSDEGHSTLYEADKNQASSSDSYQIGSVGQNTEVDYDSSVSQSLPGLTNAAVEQTNDNITKPLEDYELSWLDYVGSENATSDENYFTSQDNDFAFLEGTGDNENIVNEASIKDAQACTVDDESNIKLNNSSGDLLEEDRPLLVQECEVLLLPYKEDSITVGKVANEPEAISSSIGCGQEDTDFFGFSDMFAEPETVEGPVFGPSLPNEIVAGNSSDSEPEEVDNSDSPVSVESCLAHFIKPELLADENAWYCENCSKVLQRQKLEAKKRLNRSKALINGVELNVGSELFQKDSPSSLDAGTVDNGHSCSKIAGYDLVACNQVIERSSKNCTQGENGQTGELNLVFFGNGERKGEGGDADLDNANSVAYNDSYNQDNSAKIQGGDACHVEGSYGSFKHQPTNSNKAESSQSEESENEEMNCAGIKVKRNATKRFLIHKVPPILTIHLKRFSQDVRGRLSKLNGHVDFRETLDLQPYLDPRSQDLENCVYRLVGVIEHQGTMRGGHYVAYVRGEEKTKGNTEDDEEGGSVWYHASDAYVRQASLEEVLRSEAYILFYERI